MTAPRIVGLLALLALVPVGIYASGVGVLTDVETIITFVNVLLISGSVFFLFGDAPADSHGTPQ